VHLDCILIRKATVQFSTKIIFVFVRLRLEDNPLNLVFLTLLNLNFCVLRSGTSDFSVILFPSVSFSLHISRQRCQQAMPVTTYSQLEADTLFTVPVFVTDPVMISGIYCWLYFSLELLNRGVIVP